MNVERLDRYQAWSYKILGSSRSDHSSLVAWNTMVVKPDNILFGFIKVWFKHEGFTLVVQDSWNKNLEAASIVKVMEKKN